jgi:hypothetical protein
MGVRWILTPYRPKVDRESCALGSSVCYARATPELRSYRRIVMSASSAAPSGALVDTWGCWEDPNAPRRFTTGRPKVHGLARRATASLNLWFSAIRPSARPDANGAFTLLACIPVGGLRKDSCRLWPYTYG